MLRLKDVAQLPAGEPVCIADRVWWVGHHIGDTTLHSYLIEQGEHSVLIHPGSMRTLRHTLAKVEQVVPFNALRWFICARGEPDVAGALPLLDQLVHRADARVVTSRRVAETLAHLDLDLGVHVIDDANDAIPLEDRTLRFLPTPYMHSQFASLDEATGTLFWGELGPALRSDQPCEAANAADIEAICTQQARYLPHRQLLEMLLRQLSGRTVRRVCPRQGQLISAPLADALITSLSDVQCVIDRDELRLPDRDERPTDDRLPDLRDSGNSPPDPTHPVVPVPIALDEAYARAVRDGLTGLYSREHMADTVARWTRFQDRDSDQMVSLIVFDVDGMADINARAGNAAGDRVLVRIAEVVRQQCRDEDLPVRLSGEVFALCLFGDNPDAAPSLASRICAIMRSQRFDAGDASIRVTLSAGTTCRTHGEPIADALARADDARLAAKRAGGDCVETR